MGLLNLRRWAILVAHLRKAVKSPRVWLNTPAWWRELAPKMLAVKELRSMFAQLDNYKTILIAVAVGLASAAQALGWISPETLSTILQLLGPAVPATLAHKAQRMAAADGAVGLLGGVKRAYLVSLLSWALGALQMAGYVTPELYALILSLLGAGGAEAVSSAFNGAQARR